MERSAEGGGHHLDAAADAEEGNLAVVGEACQEEFEGVAFGVDAAEGGSGVLVPEEGVEVCAARKEESVDAVEQVEEGGVGLAARGHHDGHAARGLDGAEIAGEELEAVIREVARDGDERTPFFFDGMGALELGELRRKVERSHAGESVWGVVRSGGRDLWGTSPFSRAAAARRARGWTTDTRNP